MNGLFRVDGLSGMLEVKYYKMMDYLSPFLGDILLLYCVDDLYAPISKFLVIYVDLMRLLKFIIGSFWDKLRL